MNTNFFATYFAAYRSRRSIHRLALAVAVGLLGSACSTAAGPSAAPGATPSAALSPIASADSPPSPAASRAPRTTPTPSTTEDPLAGRLEAEIDVPGGPDFPIAAFDAMWLLTPDEDPSVTRLDPATNEIAATVPVGTRLCQAIGATDAAIWACTRGGVIRIDPASNEVVATLEFPTAEFYGYLPAGGGFLWALSGEVARMDELVRIDPADNSFETYPLGFDAEWITYGDDALWLTDTSDGKLWKFDPETEAVTEVMSALPEPGASAFGAGSVWLTLHAAHQSRPDPEDTTLIRIDPVTGDVGAEFATGSSMFESMVHASDDAVWLRSGTPFLARIDPATNEIVDSIDVNRSTGSVTVAFGSVWATTIERNKVWRVTP